MNSLDRLRSAREQLESAVEFVALISRPIAEGERVPCHSLQTPEVTISIVAQEWHGTRQKIFNCHALDTALAEVIKERFSELSQAAIARMEACVEQRKLDAYAELQELAP
jgi:hypothetical protein